MRILVLTGPSEGLKFGVNDRVTKNIDPRQLKEIIKKTPNFGGLFVCF